MVRLTVWCAVLLTALATAAAAAAGEYDAAVGAGGPSMYWRFEEAAGSPIAVDSSGNGFDLAYTSAALLETGAGIDDESTSSTGVDGATAATARLTDAPRPAAVELWLRMTPSGPDGAGRTEIVYRAKMGGTFWLVEVDGDGVVRASMSKGDEAEHSLVGGDDHAVRMAGPAAPVDDGFWHYVVVDFGTGYVYVDLAEGPAPLVGSDAPPADNAASVTAADTVDATTSVDLDPTYYEDLAPVSTYSGVDSLNTLGTVGTVGGVPLMSTATPPQFVQLGTTYDGELDEVAVYPQSLSRETMAAHAAAGGLHWDVAETTGGEESAAVHCLERGLFWKGAASTDGSANYRATGALNYITTTTQSNRCGAAAPSGKKPVFVSGQTIRVKLNNNTENYYVEFGPIQFMCGSPVRTCYGLFFNFKAPTPNGVADGFGNVNDIYWQRFQDVPDPRISGCNPRGTHGWKLQHENRTWVAYFLCDVTTTNWVPFYRYNHGGDYNADRGWVDGWPDVEGFDQSYASRGCANRDNAPLRCWQYEGTMAATHFNFRYQNPGNAFAFDPVAFGVCRVDRSVKYDGRTTTSSPPIAISVVKQPRAVVNDNCA